MALPTGVLVPDPERAHDPRAAEVLDLVEGLFAGHSPRDYSVRLWDGTERPPEAGRQARFTLVFHRPDALYRMLVPPGTRALGEAYASGDFDVEGDMIAFFDLLPALLRNTSPRAITALLPRLRRLREGRPQNVLPGKPRLSGRIHNPDRDKVAVRHHYDLNTNFFALWLDKRMVYSCSYFPTGKETLDESQEKKLELVCRKLRLQKGDRLLDLGCGFGGLVMFATQHFGVKAMGITLSEQHGLVAQKRIAEAGLGD